MNLLHKELILLVNVIVKYIAVAADYRLSDSRIGHFETICILSNLLTG